MARMGRAAITCCRSSGLIRDQRLISSRLRRQPLHSPVAEAIRQIPMQGLSIPLMPVRAANALVAICGG